MSNGFSAASDSAALYAELLDRDRDLYAANRLVMQAREINQQQVRDLKALDREVEVLTVERDNALLRVEELEAVNAEQNQLIDEDRALILKLTGAGGV
jgi:hypothetical protein